jgi:hypothetical protein
MKLGDDSDGSPTWAKAVGIFLAIASATIIGASTIFTKMGLLQAKTLYGDEPGKGHAYLKTTAWWIGMVMSKYINSLCLLSFWECVEGVGKLVGGGHLVMKQSSPEQLDAGMGGVYESVHKRSFADADTPQRLSLDISSIMPNSLPMRNALVKIAWHQQMGNIF